MGLWQWGPKEPTNAPTGAEKKYSHWMETWKQTMRGLRLKKKQHVIGLRKTSTAHSFFWWVNYNITTWWQISPLISCHSEHKTLHVLMAPCLRGLFMLVITWRWNTAFGWFPKTIKSISDFTRSYPDNQKKMLLWHSQEHWCERLSTTESGPPDRATSLWTDCKNTTSSDVSS